MGSAVETSRPTPKAAPNQNANGDPFDHEQRYLLSRGEMRRFLDTVAPRAAIEIYDPERPISYTRTTYLDTNDLAYFRTGDGAPARRLRIREYAVAATAKDAPVLSGVAFVELKQHDGPARSKVRFAASPVEIARLLGHREAGPSLTMTAAQAEIARELALPTMAPRLATWYRRLCLTAEARRVRITLDENLTFCQPQPIGEAGALAAPREREVVAAFPARVLEIKHCGEMPFWLGPALESLEPAESFSKFRMGMTALGHSTEARKEPDGLAPAIAESPLFALASFVAA
ncbi:MAG TPA: VTC domain-containing protein [Polyangia bacterium]|nr:VTC domain-containing protein [Polyangia bacterium]